MTEGGPGGPGAAQNVFQDPSYTDQLLAMHRASTPFVEMAAKVGVTLSPEYTQLVEGLSAADVQIIRAAMVEALESGEATMPYHCRLQALPPSLIVTALGPPGHLLANIAPGK
jgi:hypothetical protein